MIIFGNVADPAHFGTDSEIVGSVFIVTQIRILLGLNCSIKFNILTTVPQFTFLMIMIIINNINLILS